MEFLHQGRTFTTLDDLVTHLEQSNECLARIEALLTKNEIYQKEEQTDDNQS